MACAKVPNQGKAWQTPTPKRSPIQLECREQQQEKPKQILEVPLKYVTEYREVILNAKSIYNSEKTEVGK